MTRLRWRRLARAEQLIGARIKKMRDEGEKECENHARFVEDFGPTAQRKLDCLAVLVLFGGPRVGEPLTETWQRATTSDRWNDYCATYGDLRQFAKGTGLEGDDTALNPFCLDGVIFISKFFSKYILPDLPGHDDACRLNRLLNQTPPWLLWHTDMDFWAQFILQLDVPDLSGVSHLLRESGGLCLPRKAFEALPRPGGERDPDYIPPRAIRSILLELTSRPANGS